MGDPQDDEKDEEWMKEVYGKEYTGPPKPSDIKDRDNSTVNKKTASDNESDEDEKIRDPNAIPTGFTSREAKVWESKAKSAERNWKRKKEEELICRICGEKGHFTQGCPTTLGVNKKSRAVIDRISSREKNIKPRFAGTGGSRHQGFEKDTGFRFEPENNSAGDREAFYTHTSRSDRNRPSKSIGASNRRFDRVEEDRDENMGRQGSNRGSNVNSLVAAQMQHIAAQRMQHNSGSQPFPGALEIPAMDIDQRYASSQADNRWKWEGTRNGPNSMPSHMYQEGRGPTDPGSINISPSKGRGTEGGSPYYQGRISDSKPQEGKANDIGAKESERKQLDVGYEDQSQPQSLEVLEKKLMDEIMSLTREQHVAEDEENTRHREHTRAIYEQYQVKLTALRAQHAKRREDFLRRESQLRLEQYQQVVPPKQYHESVGGPALGYNSNLHDHRGYGAGLGEGQQGYPGGYESRRDDVQYYGNAAHAYGRGQGYDMREAYPGSRVYDSAQSFR